MKVLVLGHRGLIGNSIFRILKSSGYDVITVIDIPSFDDSFDFYRTNHSRFNALLNSVQLVIYAISDFNPATCPEINTPLYTDRIATFSLFLSVIRDLNIKLYYCSSGGAVYGSLENTEIFYEYNTPRPVSNYGKLKYNYEKLIIHFLSNTKNGYCIFRISNLFSYLQYHNSNQGIIGVFARKIINNEEVLIYSNGETVRDYISLNDAIYLMIKILESNGSGIFNISSSIGIKTLDIFKFLGMQLGKSNYSKVSIQEDCYNSPHKVLLSNIKLFTYLKIHNFFSEEYLFNQIREEVKHILNERRP